MSSTGSAGGSRHRRDLPAVGPVADSTSAGGTLAPSATSAPSTTAAAVTAPRRRDQPGRDGNPIPLVDEHVSGDGAGRRRRRSDNTKPHSTRSGSRRTSSSAPLPAVRYDLTYQGDVDGRPTWPASASTRAVRARGTLTGQRRPRRPTRPTRSRSARPTSGATVSRRGHAGARSARRARRSTAASSRTSPAGTASSSPVYVPAVHRRLLRHVGRARRTWPARPRWSRRANPSWTPRRSRTSSNSGPGHGTANNPPTQRRTGHGLLTLGAPADIDRCRRRRGTQPITPTRILDTRNTAGGHRRASARAARRRSPSPAYRPTRPRSRSTSPATAPTGNTHLAAYPGGTASPGTSNLNLRRRDSTAAVFAIVTHRAGTDTLTVQQLRAAP